jgi:hypothetical protein
MHLADGGLAAGKGVQLLAPVLDQVGAIEDDRLGAGGKRNQAVLLAPSAELFPVVAVRAERGAGPGGAEGVFGLGVICLNSCDTLSSLLNRAAAVAIRKGRERIDRQVLDGTDWVRPSERRQRAELLI